jgi:hypothetical protein
MLTTTLAAIATSSIHSMTALPPVAIALGLGALAYAFGGLAFVRYVTNTRAPVTHEPVNTLKPTPVYKAAA